MEKKNTSNKKTEDYNYKFHIRGKLYLFAILAAVIFSTILSIVLYYGYSCQQDDFIKVSLENSINSYLRILNEHYEKLSLAASDIAKMALIMKNEKLPFNLGSLYSFANIDQIYIYDQHSKSFISSKNNYINVMKLKKGINYIKTGKELDIYYMRIFENAIVVLFIKPEWFFGIQHKISTPEISEPEIAVKINSLNIAYEIPKSKDTKIKSINISALSNNYFIKEKSIESLTVYSFITKESYLKTNSKIIYLIIFLIYIISFAITLLIIFLMNILFVRKIKKIVHHIAKIQKGELNYQIQLKGNDEISYLASHINTMTGKLSSLIRDQRKIIDKKSYIIEERLRQEEKINELIIKITQNSESAERVLQIVHDFLIEEGTTRFYHYRINKEGDSFELLKNYNYHELPRKFSVSLPNIQEIFALYDKGKIESVEIIIKKLCKTEKYNNKLYLIDYKNKLIGFMEIEWKDKKGGEIIMLPILKTLPIIINNIYMRDSLIKTTRELQEANKAKNEFLNIMSHELRTPLNAILGFTQILLRKPEELNKRQYKYINNIYIAGSTLLDIINDILDLSKIQSGKREIHIEEFNLQKMVNEIVTILKPLSKEKNINLSLNLQLKTKNIYSDESAIKHILTNLVSNAIKYTSEGGKVYLNIEANKEKLKIIVKDTGIGIPKEKINYIFEPFKRLQKDEYSRNIKGTGLGLAIVKEYVEILGGTKDVQSEVGIGSTFTIELPIKKIDFPTKVRDGECAKEILIIENDENDIEIYKNMFMNSYKITIARTLQEGINTFSNTKPKIIILDLRLPDMSGVYLINKLNEDIRFRCTNIVVSSILEKRDFPGIKYYIQKPIRDLLEFQETINKLMYS